MTPERWQQIKTLVNSALTRQSLARIQFLEQACAGDAPLRQGVATLIAYCEQAAPSSATDYSLQLPADEPIAPERWQCIEQVFQDALERQTEQRAAFLSQACAGDQTLRREVESLLAYQSTAAAGIDAAVRYAAQKVAGESPTAGQRIGSYQIIRELGHGGMGAVYLAVRADDAYRQRVAIKLIRRGMDTEDIQRRFRHERQILAALDHPHIARLLDGGTTGDGLPYFVMEYIEGEPIDEYCRARRLTTAERLQLFRTVCAAVHYAHQNLVVHRDIKPSNILVTASEGKESGTVKLLDFGIAKILNPELFPETVLPTRTWERPMTPAYASPEQVRGQMITTASDVYSLGVVLYELLTGQRPYQFKGAAPHEIAQVVCETEPQRPSTAVVRKTTDKTGLPGDPKDKASDIQAERLSRQLKGDLDNIVLMALRKEPQRRYASAEQFSEDIRRHLEGRPVRAREDTLTYRADKFVRRNKAAVVAAAVIVVLLLGFVVTQFVQSGRVTRERDRAQRERDKAERVSAFLVDLFKVSDPSESKGNTVTAREILDKGGDKIRQELKDQPEVQATLMDTIGNVYRELGLYDRAAPLLDEALRIRRAQYGPEHAEVAASMQSVAGLAKDKGDFETAEQTFRQVLAMRRRQFGAEHLEVAGSLTDLASAHYEQGEFDDAEALLREALVLRRKLLGDEREETAENLMNLAEVLVQKGDLNSTEPMYRTALAVKRRVLGNEHPRVSMTINNLAGLLHLRGDYAGAETLYREVLAIDRKMFGAEHPNVAMALNNLGATLHAQGNYEAAEPLLREMLAIRRRTLGEDHPRVTASLNNLAVLLRSKGDYAAAESLFRESLARERQGSGREHPNTANTINNLAMLFHYQGDLRAAEPLYREALNLRRKLLPAGHAEIADSMIGLAALLSERGEGQTAESLAREALEMLRSALPADHWRNAEAESVLGASLAAQRRFAEAEPLLTASYPIIKAKRGEREPRTRLARTRLATLYQAWSKPDKAALYRPQ